MVDGGNDKKGITPTAVTYTDILVGYYIIEDEKKDMMYNSVLQAGIAPVTGCQAE